MFVKNTYIIYEANKIDMQIRVVMKYKTVLTVIAFLLEQSR